MSFAAAAAAAAGAHPGAGTGAAPALRSGLGGLGLDSSSVIARIESCVESLVGELAEGRVPQLQLAARGGGALLGAPPPQPDAEGQEQGERETSRSLLRKQGAGAMAYARVLVVLNTVHELLREGRQATQRDLYYKLLNPPLFASVRDVYAAIADASALLRVPRSRLGVTCAGRGAVAGRLQLRDGPASPWLDCSTAGPSGRALPGDLATIAAYGMQLPAAPLAAASQAAAAVATMGTQPLASGASAAAGAGAGAAGAAAGAADAGGPAAGAAAAAGAGMYLLVVEKDAVFQRLAEERIWEHLPCIIVTARGVPDLATRAFVSRLAAAFPRLQPAALVDYNPPGVMIMATYKYGSDRMGPEGRAHPLPGLRWLGLRSGQLAAVEEQHLQRLTERDGALLRRLRAQLAGPEPAWAAELEAMEAAGFKGDIEALYSTGSGYAGLRDTVVRAVLSRDLI